VPINCHDYSHRLGARLRDRVLHTIFPHLAQGFLIDRRTRLGIQTEPTEQERADLFDATLTLLFRLLFLFYAESRGLLPHPAASLKQLREEVAKRAGMIETDVAARLEKAYACTETNLYDRLTRLCRSLNVLTGNGGLFITDPDDSDCPQQRSARFLLQHKVPDCFLALAFDRLARDQDEKTSVLAFIDYSSLEVRHLGSLYEGLLGFKLQAAEKVSLTREKTGRRASGSFYTPDAIVAYIVTNTVGTVLDQKLEALRPAFGKRRRRFDRLFDLKVLDPAMGSGHFLVEAVRCITERLLRFLNQLPNQRTDAPLLRWHVLERCIHGVDLDPLAVELARISLWLDAAIPGMPLRILHRPLHCGHALTGESFADSPGYDVVLGNPPYDVLAAKELETDLEDVLAYFHREPIFAPACGGKLNLYKLFLCRGIDLLRPGGRLGYIVPMALLGDEQAIGVRKMLLDRTSLVAVEAFPQKDDPNNRVFRDAKLSTCVVITANTTGDVPFRCRVHPGKSIDENAPSLLLRRATIALHDPDNLPIPACSQDDWDLVLKILGSGRMLRLGQLATAHQGEVNEKTDGNRGHISSSPDAGPRILRGSNLCLYALRGASQGQPIYLRQDQYLQGKRPTARAWHFRHNRVGFQRSAPQNNFRRLIACLIPAGHFCCDTVSYFPESESKLPLAVLIALFNSKLLDWFFRLGSTSSKVNDYQVQAFPVPTFQITASPCPAPSGFARLLADGRLDELFPLIEPLMVRPPFPSSLMTCIERLVEKITQIEAGRGVIARRDRSLLDPLAQCYQDVLDRLFYRLAGLSDEEAAGLESRLARML
jgi:hypothetical protein